MPILSNDGIFYKFSLVRVWVFKHQLCFQNNIWTVVLCVGFGTYLGAVRGEVDLLPPPSPATNWTAALPTLPSSDSSLVFSFNGSTHVAVVPESVASTVSGDHFTLQLWMRRGGASTQPPTNQARGTRKEEETIICTTVKNGQSVISKTIFLLT